MTKRYVPIATKWVHRILDDHLNVALGSSLSLPLSGTATSTEPSMPVFGQLVTGPPGAGKTTYCHGMHQASADRDWSIMHIASMYTDAWVRCDPFLSSFSQPSTAQ